MLTTVQRHLNCTPDDVFGVLGDGWTYPIWVVGASRMRAVDPSWPQVGAKLHHSAGIWPLLINDSTSILVWDPPRQVVLEARGWPAGVAKVDLTVQPEESGCRVSIREDVVRGPSRLIPQAARQALMNVRNQETLRRLAYLAEGRGSTG